MNYGIFGVRDDGFRVCLDGVRDHTREKARAMAKSFQRLRLRGKLKHYASYTHVEVHQINESGEFRKPDTRLSLTKKGK